MSSSSRSAGDAGQALADIFDSAVPQVYGYLLPRCGDVSVAEELTAEALLAAAVAVKSGVVREVTVAWLIGIARHKLVDHWRRRERERRNLALLAAPVAVDDPWDELLEAQRAHEVLARLPATQRIALALRYLDGLPVTEVAARIDRTEHGTETLLVRARAAFRRIYTEGDAGDDD